MNWRRRPPTGPLLLHLVPCLLLPLALLACHSEHGLGHDDDVGLVDTSVLDLRSVAVGDHSCTLDGDGRACCDSRTDVWDESWATMPEHELITLDVGLTRVHGVTTDHEVRTWGATWLTPLGPEPAKLSSAHWRGHCELDLDGEVQCWGIHAPERVRLLGSPRQVDQVEHSQRLPC